MAISSTSRPTDLRLALPPTPDAAGRARQALAEAKMGLELRHTVTLLATELVANAVRHAGVDERQRIVLLATLEEDFARVEVFDPGPGFDPEIRHDTSGFGLRLIDKLASDWTTERSDDGCRVWFEVDRRRRRFER